MLNKLYKKSHTYSLKVYGNKVWWIVSLTPPTAGENRPDCVITHPAKRNCIRTKKGLELKKYDSLNELVFNIREEGKKYDVNFSKYKIIENTVEEGRKVVKGGKIVRKLKVKEKNADKIMRIIGDSNNLEHPYKVAGYIYKNKFKLVDVSQDPIPLINILNKKDNFETIRKIVINNYQELKKYDYKNRGYKYFTGSPPDSYIGGFLVPLKWFDYIQYIA